MGCVSQTNIRPPRKFSIYPCISHDFVIFVPSSSSSKQKPPFFFPTDRNVCHGGRSDFNPSFAGMECCGSAIFKQSSVSYRCFSKRYGHFFGASYGLNHLPPQKKQWLSQYKNPCPPKNFCHLRRLEVKDFVEQKPAGRYFGRVGAMLASFGTCGLDQLKTPAFGIPGGVVRNKPVMPLL